MESNFHHKQAGFSLVEVLIASGIGLAIFLYLNQSIIQLQSTQQRIEKREDVRQIQSFISHHLSSYRAWRDNPETRVPSASNSIDLYYYPGPRSAILPFAHGLEVFNQTWRHSGGDSLNCPEEMGDNCRVLAFDHRGVFLSLDDLESRSVGRGLFLAFISIETPAELISRSFLPEFKVLITDVSGEESRIFDRQFYVNSFDSSQDLDEKGIVDSLARVDCFSDFMRTYSHLPNFGIDLCEYARSQAPSTCYRRMKTEFQVRDPVAMVTCSRALNHIPVECFDASSRLNTSQSHRAILCHQATSLAPLECVEKILEAGGRRDQEEIYRVCSRAQDLSPAECFIEMSQNFLNYMEFTLRLCPHYRRG